MTTLESGSGTGVLAGDHRMLIDGKLEATASGALFDVVNPATDGTVDDMERAIGAARRAIDTTAWSRDVEFRYHWRDTGTHESLGMRAQLTPWPGSELGRIVCRRVTSSSRPCSPTSTPRRRSPRRRSSGRFSR